MKRTFRSLMALAIAVVTFAACSSSDDDKYLADVNLPVYRPEISLLCNIAQLFSDRYGGDPDFYLAMGGAALKLLSEKSLRDVHEYDISGLNTLPLLPVDLLRLLKCRLNIIILGICRDDPFLGRSEPMLCLL